MFSNLRHYDLNSRLILVEFIYLKFFFAIYFKKQLLSLKSWNGVNHYSGSTFSWDQGNNSKPIKQILLIMQRRSHKVTGRSMFYIHEHIIKSLRHAIKFYILILYPTALNSPHKKIRLLNDPSLSHRFYMSAVEAHVEFVLLSTSINHRAIKKIIYPLFLDSRSGRSESSPRIHL